MTGPAAWQPYHEPLTITLRRTGILGLALGTAVAFTQGHRADWLLWTAFALWFTFGGHWVEIFFLNWLRVRLPATHVVQVPARVVTWLVGGTLLMFGARQTVLALGGYALHLPPWGLGGPLLVAVELVAHAFLQLRGQPNFYNGAR